MPPVDLGNSDCDPLGNALTHGGVLKRGILLSIGDKAQFKERRRALVVMEDIVAREFHPAAVRTVATRDFAKDASCQRSRAGIVIVGLDSIGGTPVGPVAMDAHKCGLGMGVGDAGAASQGNEDIRRSGHDHMVAPGFKKGFHTSGHIEGQHFLVESPDRFGPVVISPMSRIENNRSEAGQISVRFKEGATRQQDEREQGQQAQRSDHEGGLGHDEKGI